MPTGQTDYSPTDDTLSIAVANCDHSNISILLKLSTIKPITVTPTVGHIIFLSFIADTESLLPVAPTVRHAANDKMFVQKSLQLLPTVTLTAGHAGNNHFFS